MTPSSSSKLCDRTALRRNRSRAKPDAMFLHREAITEAQDRLALVNKQFKNPAIVTGYPDFWGELFGDASYLEDTDTLDVDSNVHDLMIHAMSLHWADDPVGQLIQCRRALKPDGMFMAVLPAGETLSELRACLGQAETEIRGGLSPRVVPMADLRDLGALLQRAGFALPVADSISLTAEYDSLFALARDLRDMGEGNALMSRDKRIPPRSMFERADTIYRQSFPGSQKAIRATFELVTLTGWAPAESQPKALRPGSAQTRLADALGTKESPLRD